MISPKNQARIEELDRLRRYYLKFNGKREQALLAAGRMRGIKEGAANQEEHDKADFLAWLKEGCGYPKVNSDIECGEEIEDDEGQCYAWYCNRCKEKIKELSEGTQ